MSLPAADIAQVRVALLRPPSFHVLGNLSYFGAIPPIGLAYVAAVLRDAGHRVQVVDGAGEAPHQVEKMTGACRGLYRIGLTPAQMVDALAPDTEVVGITNMFGHEWPTVAEIATRVRARLPDAFIVLGGENATACWENMLRECAAIDACVLGEGEHTMLEVMARLRRGLPLHDLAGVATRDGGSQARLAPRLTHLEDLPWPAWELFPMEGYFRAHDAFGVHRGRSIPMLATRGCPFQCTFCSSPSMWTTRYVTRPPADVVDEIRTYVERYGVENVDFCDLTAIVKRDWILEFCRLLEESNLRITWQLPVGTRSEALDAEVLRAVYRTGCRNVTYAPESGSPRMLDIVKKRVRLPRLLESVSAAVKIGLVVRLSFILGHPEETRADVWETVKLLVKTAWMGCQDVSVLIFSPYPGSEDYRKLRQSGAVGGASEDDYLALVRSGRSARSFNKVMGLREILVLQWAMLMTFYAVACIRRPMRVIEFFRSLVTGREATHLEQLVRTKVGHVQRALASSRKSERTREDRGGPLSPTRR